MSPNHFDRDVTLGIPCFNEEAVISETLSTIGEFEGEFDRVIVLDDGSTDGTPEIARRFEFVDLFEFERNRGRGSARNRILAETTTPLLAMIDADIHPQANWLPRLREAMVRSGAEAVGGRVIVPGDTPADRWRRNRLQVNDYEDERYVPYLAGGNTLFETTAVRSVGGWPDLQSHEDRKLSDRLRNADHSLYFVPDATVCHVGDVSSQSVLRNLWRWHYESRNEPERLADIPLRATTHVGKGIYYVMQDVLAARWRSVPISARLPIEFVRQDLERLK